jgi:hypothetical protein
MAPSFSRAAAFIASSAASINPRKVKHDSMWLLFMRNTPDHLFLENNRTLVKNRFYSISNFPPEQKRSDFSQRKDPFSKVHNEPFVKKLKVPKISTYP